MTDIPSQAQAPDPRAWLAVGGAIFATFIALLDISVTNASLPQIQAEVGATGTEGTWIGTGYLAAEIIMFPLTAWFGRMLGMRNFMMLSAIMFTVLSIMCGSAVNLINIVVGRIGQGFFGGAMIPASMTIIATRLTEKQRPLGLAIYSTVSVVAPIIGPIIGGYLTENVSWRWLFFMNVPVAVVFMPLLYLGLEAAPFRREELHNADWLGIAGLVLFLGCLTIVLEEGQRESWFDSQLIIWLCVTSIAGAVLIAAGQFISSHPIVKLRALRKSNVPPAFVLMTVFSIALFPMLYIAPVFLGTIAGYNAEQTGFITVYSGLGTFISAPVVSMMIARTDIRLVVAIGMGITAISCFMNLGLTAQSVGADFVWPLFVFGLALIIVALPLSQASTTGMPEDAIADGSAIFNMARNFGGSVGLASAGVLIDRRLTFHISQLEQSTTANSILGNERIMQAAGMALRDGSDPVYATLKGLRMISGEIQRQALVMSYADAFWLLGVMVLASLPVVFFLRPIKGGAPAVLH